ncbi:MAG: outer membrane protein assembly factor BamD [Candidatus Acidiferrales bacterium]
MTAIVVLSAAQCDAQIFHKKKRVNKSTSADNSAEPDKILYDRGLADIKRGRQEVGRLGMQTLINTYPDSEYLAKAKLSIADSYYKEGGTANMTQAINGYKDFIVFFPFLQEASYAQLQVAMAYYREMEKPDRDRTQAKAAEEEFQTFLQKYPKDPLAPKAEQRLREVQEVLAEGDYRIGYYYYVKGDRRAAAARLLTVAKRYPLYSKSDRTLWMLGDIFEKSEHKEVASLYYAQIVRNYPLSGLAGRSKDKLKSFGVPVPQADPKALAWQQAELSAPRPHTPLVKRPLALVQSGAGREKQLAARSGQPDLQPEPDNASATDILTGGNQSRIGGTGGGVGSTAVVETVTPGTGEAAAGNEATSGAEGASAPAGGNGSDANPPAAGEPNGSTAPASTGSNATDATNGAATADSAQKTDTPSTDQAQNADGTKTDAAQDTSQKPTDGDGKKESSSKKKKGLRKIIPW